MFAILTYKSSVLRNEQVKTANDFIKTISVISKVKRNLCFLRINLSCGNQLENFRIAKKLLRLFVVIHIDDIGQNEGRRDMDKTSCIQGSFNIEFVCDDLKQIQTFKMPFLEIFFV